MNPPPRTFSTEVYVSFGDCDPAGIVYYPNFYRWFDLATQRMSDSVGLTLHAMRRDHGWLGMPLVEAHARFVRPATHGDTIRIDTRAVGWRRKTFRLEHRVWRGDTLLCEGWEERILGEPVPGDPHRIRAVEIPEHVRALLA